ncbi:integrase [Haloarcula amylolytica JCM 13557]|uniref:Integrase n=1 Tax=Haloarcula amylolytica JCM 13557 TaxID=1227452 RepID=M0K4L2_9EURY|nr:integrase [Haloarcula amylolytica JCM 13557]
MVNSERISYLANQTDMDLNHLHMMAGHAKFETTLQYAHTNWDAARESYRGAVSNTQ